jgi:hypothetical protein
MRPLRHRSVISAFLGGSLLSKQGPARTADIGYAGFVVRARRFSSTHVSVVSHGEIFMSSPSGQQTPEVCS